MALVPSIEVYQNDPGFFFIKETTPDYSALNPGGYGVPNRHGVPNPVLSMVDKIQVELTYPSGSTVTFEAIYKRGDADWKVNFSDLQNISTLVESGCDTCITPPEKSTGPFPSGCYKLKYKVMGFGIKIVEQSNYSLSLIGNPLTDSIWVKKDGVFFDVTGIGTWVGNNFQWSALATFNEYVEFELRAGAAIKQFGTVTKVGLGIFQTNVGTDFVVLGETVKHFALIYNEVKKYHDTVYRVLGIGKESCYDFFSDPCDRGSDLSELVIIKSKLDLISGEKDDCVYISSLLKRINVLFKSIDNG